MDLQHVLLLVKYFEALLPYSLNFLTKAHSFTFNSVFILFNIFYIKITLCLMFLILIRGGVPRYRYDFLTKMVWIKFLIYILSLFVTLLIFYLV